MARTIPVSGLDQTAYIGENDLIEVAVVDATSLTGYSSKSAKIGSLGENVEYEDLNTENKTLVAAINEVQEGLGSTVEPNPEEEATEELTKLKINGIVYALAGASYPNYEEEQF